MMAKTYKKPVYNKDMIPEPLQAYMEFKSKSDIFSSLMASDSLALGIYNRNFRDLNLEQMTESHLWLLALE